MDDVRFDSIDVTIESPPRVDALRITLTLLRHSRFGVVLNLLRGYEERIGRVVFQARIEKLYERLVLMRCVPQHASLGNVAE